MADILIKTENNNKVVEIKNENEIGSLGNAIGMRRWNQLVQDVGSTKTVRGITFTKNGDGSYTVNGTTSSQGNAENLVSTSFPVQDNHKYLVSGAKGNAKIQVWAKNAVESKVIDNGGGIIFTGLSTDINLTVYIRVDMNTTVNNITIFPQLFDLTQLFGVGNEPTTVEEFKKLFPADYYPYHPINDLSDFGYEKLSNGLVQLKDGNNNVFVKSTFGWADRRHDGAITIPSIGFIDIKDYFEIPEGTFACQIRTYGTAQDCFNVAYNLPGALYLFGKPNTVIGSYLTLRFYYIIN